MLAQVLRSLLYNDASWKAHINSVLAGTNRAVQCLRRNFKLAFRKSNKLPTALVASQTLNVIH